MSGNLIGGIIGAGIALMIPGAGWALAAQGFAIGSAIGGVLMPGELPPVQGPRLEDLRAQSSEYGRPIPIVYGTVGIAGNIIWSTDIVEVATTTEQGGKGGPSQEVTEYSYYGNFAVAICDGEADVLRIWAGPEKRLIYDGFLLEGGGSIRIYRGTEDQLPDPLIEQDKGVGNVPAYRGTCYVVFENYPLANDLNRLPFLTFEVSTSSGGIGTNYTEIGSSRLYNPPPQHVLTHSGTIMRGSAQDPTDEMLYVTRNEGGVTYLDKIDLDVGLVGSLAVGTGNAIMALNPLTRKVAVYEGGTTYTLVNLETFTASTVPTPGGFVKADLIYSAGLGDFAWLNHGNQYVDGQPHGDNWGRYGAVAGGTLVDCGDTVAAVSITQPTTIGGTSIGHNKQFEIYDPVSRRLISFEDACYYDLDSGELVEVDPSVEVQSPLNLAYNPYIRRILGITGTGMAVFDPTTFSEDGFPVETTLFGGSMLYSSDPSDLVLQHFSITPVVLPNMRTHMAFVDRMLGSSAPAGDIFLFKVGTTGAGMVLGDIVADLCERAGFTESDYDVGELTDIVDGYAIAKQTDIRSAIDALRSAYYFDAVESQGVVKFVKRGGTTITVIPDEDLRAHASGSEPGDPLKTTRIQEVELPRSVTVSYLQAATDYSTATKTAKRLTGYSEDQTALEMPLVLSDTKAQEVAEVNLHAAWAQRLQYEFSTGRKYSHLEPTDLVQVKGYVMRIVKVTASPFGILKFHAVSDESVYAPHVVVTETPPNGGTVYVPGETVLAIM